MFGNQSIENVAKCNAFMTEIEQMYANFEKSLKPLIEWKLCTLSPFPDLIISIKNDYDSASERIHSILNSSRKAFSNHAHPDFLDKQCITLSGVIENIKLLHKQIDMLYYIQRNYQIIKNK